MKKLKVGIVGCGAMGSQIAHACQAGLAGSVELAAVCDIDRTKALSLRASLKEKVPAATLDGLIEKVDLVVESSSAAASASIVDKCIKNKTACLVMSVGGLLAREELLRKAEKGGVRIYVPSGALCGIDALKAASVGKISSVTLTTRKPPRGLVGAPYLKLNRIDVMAVKKETTIFEGSAAEAVKGFPANVNVSAVLSLAGIGRKKTVVRIVTSPEYTSNIHEVEITGDAGRVSARTENVPSKANPKTSALAIYSAIATLKEIVKSVRIGT